jgi:2'-5' RNA ligase
VPERNLHLTLHFFGELDENMVERLDPGLRDAFASGSRTRLRLEAAGCFPPARPARVAWLGVDGGDELLALHERVMAAVGRVLGPVSGQRIARFHPHLTLARPRRPWPRAAVESFRQEIFPHLSWSVDEGVLMRSRLERSGARYEAVKRYPLGV